MKIVAIFTCFNRKSKTENCIRTLAYANPDCEFTFVVVDDNSSDGTREILKNMENDYDIHLLSGNGSLFYSGGMRLGMDYTIKNLNENYNYILMMNDDVSFYNGCIERMIVQSREQSNAVIVGATCNDKGCMSYSAVKYTNGIKYRKLEITEWKVPADTFNANCVLIPYEAFKKVGVMDSNYVHSLGDFDYGLSLKRAGYSIFVSKEYVGLCEDNSGAGGWGDTSLSRIERIRKKESIKGAPTKQWFYFLKKNFGLVSAFKGCVTPYMRILLGK